MSYKTIYHGSETLVEKPIYHYKGSNEHNDYGLGFYCTQNLDMAKEWANRTTRNGFANKYSFEETVVRIYSLDFDCFSCAISFAIFEKIMIVIR